jgi:hypothetical protein
VNFNVADMARVSGIDPSIPVSGQAVAEAIVSSSNSSSSGSNGNGGSIMPSLVPSTLKL